MKRLSHLFRRRRPRSPRRSANGGFEHLEARRVLAQVAGAITADTAWTLDESPYEVTGDVTVQAGVTLKIEPGVVVQFRENTDLEVRGRLLAEGTPMDRIQFDRAPGASRWDGLAFRQTLEDSRVTYADMRYGDDQGEAVRVDRARLLLDHIVWSGTNGTVLELDHPSLIVRNSQFPTSNGDEVVHGEYITDDEYLIFEGNVFANSNNGGDVIDFLGADRPGPVLQILNNVFLGGGDDGLDLDGTDAHIEGNIFMNFLKNTSRATTANAIATGLPQSDETNRTEITVARNLFINNDHALLVKEDAFATVQHNVFVDSAEAVIQFNEVSGTSVRGPGKGAALDGNILWNNAQLFKNLEDSASFTTELTVNRSLLPNEVVDFDGTPILAHDLGVDNLAGDPRFVDAAAGNFRLQPDSPAIRQGLGGLDLGAYVSGAPLLVDLPAGPADPSQLVLTVAGPGITHYRFRLDAAAYGPLTPVTEPIRLQQLTTGSYRVDVLGMNSAGEWFVGDTPAFGERSVQIIAPQRVRTDEMLPFVLRIQDSHGQIDTQLSSPLTLLNAADLSQTDLQVKKGVGSASPVVLATDDFLLRVDDTLSQPADHNIDVLDASFPVTEHSGVLTGDFIWDATAEHHVTGDLRIPVGSSLTILAGARVLLGEDVNLRVDGQLRTQGIADDPIVFNSIVRQQPWGGVEIIGGSAELEYTFFTNGGADSSKAWGHSGSQPVIWVDQATLDLANCFVLNTVGKGFGSVNNSRINLDQAVISNVDTGGEFSSSVVNVTNSWIKDVPNDASGFVDDDNDGFYFSGAHSSGEPSRFQDSFVINTKDDGLDHNGARLEVVRAWIEGASHEGIASSNRNWVTVEDSVFLHNNQGVEAGYGRPDVTVTHSVLVSNNNQTDPDAPMTAGLRFGDGYDGRNGAYEGHITASQNVLRDNGDNVRNYDGDRDPPGPQPGAIEITQSLTNDPDYDSVPSNLTGIPVFGPQMHLLRASAGFTAGSEGLPLGRTLPPITAQLTVAARGDFNADGVVDDTDIDLLWVEIRAVEPNLGFDLTDDGRVDVQDRDEMILSVLQTSFGDSNLDGIFNSSDFVKVFVIGQYEDATPGNSGWSSGDWNADGDFTSSDMVMAFQRGGYVAAARALDAPIAAAMTVEWPSRTAQSQKLPDTARPQLASPSTVPVPRRVELAARQQLFAQWTEQIDDGSEWLLADPTELDLGP